MKIKGTKTSETILGILTGFLILFWWTNNKWLLYIAILLGLIGLFVAPLARLIEKGWMLLTKYLGYINSRIILSIVFYLILTPTAFIARLSRKDPLNLKGNGDSFYKKREHHYDKEDLKNPW